MNLFSEKLATKLHQRSHIWIYFETKEGKVYVLFWFYVQVSAESAHQFGELVADPTTKELLHYTEKPETFVRTWCFLCSDISFQLLLGELGVLFLLDDLCFQKMQVSDLINCGVYIFTPDIFTAIQDVSMHREDRGWSFSYMY